MIEDIERDAHHAHNWKLGTIDGESVWICECGANCRLSEGTG